MLINHLWYLFLREYSLTKRKSNPNPDGFFELGGGEGQTIFGGIELQVVTILIKGGNVLQIKGKKQ